MNGSFSAIKGLHTSD